MDSQTDLTLAGLVHDLNNVFQTILEAAELVSSDPDMAQVGGIIFRSVEQGRRIAASMAEKGQGILPVSQIAGQTADFAGDFTTAMKGPALEFVPDIPSGLAARMRPAAMARVLMNLFINAAQASKAAGRERCRISVSARETENAVAIEVRDDGPGIPPMVLTSIFEAGFSTGSGRSGLGLHIVRSLVTEAGGNVSAANGEPCGAVFSIVLPPARSTGSAAR